MDTWMQSSPKEVVYKVYEKEVIRRGMAPSSRSVVPDKDLDAIVTLVDSIEGADVTEFMLAQMYGLTNTELARLTFRGIARGKKKSINKFSAYSVGRGTSSYVKETRRLWATVRYFSRVWGCSDEEVIADPCLTLPAWFRCISTTNPVIRDRYEAAARQDIDSKEFQRVKEELVRCR